MPRAKGDIITFKVDKELVELMKGIENRSQFIRTAILTALESACPLCKGTGVLTPKQKEHWDAFSRDHSLRECEECHEFYLSCSAEPDAAQQH
jgi:hypothetical protein